MGRNVASKRSVSASQPSSGTEAAARVADVLLMFARGPATIGVSEIARELGLSKAVIHRILQSLSSRSLVMVDPQTHEYRLGIAAFSLGARAMQDFDVRRIARPTLRRLRDTTRETTTLSALVGDSRMYLEQFESPQEIKMTVTPGRPYPLSAGASSRAILAYLPADFAEKIIAAELGGPTQATDLRADELRQQLESVRRAGCAISRGERQEGAGSVAAPIFGSDGEVIGSISVCGPLARFDEASVGRHLPLVRSAAEEISTALGWPGPTAPPAR